MRNSENIKEQNNWKSEISRCSTNLFIYKKYKSSLNKKMLRTIFIYLKLFIRAQNLTAVERIAGNQNDKNSILTLFSGTVYRPDTPKCYDYSKKPFVINSDGKKTK